MESYPQSFAALIKRLAEEARFWTAAQVEGDAGESEQRVMKMDAMKEALKVEGTLSEDGCQQLRKMAQAAAGVMLCKLAGKDGLEAREAELAAAYQPAPAEVSEALWKRTYKLFIAGASLACAEERGDDKEEERQRHCYDRHGRAICGFGKVGSATRDAADFAAQAAQVIPANVVMFSGCQDCQTSADVFNTASFGLPSDAGPGGAGGACTSSMIKALSENTGLTWVSLLGKMREILSGKYTQIPMLSSSRQMDLNTPFTVENEAGGGKHRALLVGINYGGSNAELKGCHNDVETMKRYLLSNGYTEGDMKILLDDGTHEDPTRASIAKGFEWLAQDAQAGDSLFFHYSGHGASIKDDDDDEEDGKDEALCPCDYTKAGFFRDDDTFKYLVGPLKEGAKLTCVLDCCHSGTILDLPFLFKADEQGMQAAESGQPAMKPNANFDFGKLFQVLKDNPAMCAGAAAVAGLAYFTGGPEKSKIAGRALMDAANAENKQEAIMQIAMEQVTGKKSKACAIL